MQYAIENIIKKSKCVFFIIDTTDIDFDINYLKDNNKHSKSLGD